MMLLQTSAKLSSPPCDLMLLNEVSVTGPDSVELARSLNEMGVIHYLQNSMPSVLSLTDIDTA